MTWRDVVSLMGACVGTMMVLEIITRIFVLRGEQRLWLDVVGICVFVLAFEGWQRWGGE
jgi:hypothetical protein